MGLHVPSHQVFFCESEVDRACTDKVRLPCSKNGRKNIPMQVTIKFTGYYGTYPMNQLCCINNKNMGTG